MLEIPAEAMPVVEILRRDVPKPHGLPSSRLDSGQQMHWEGCKCPMGLHPLAESYTPTTPEQSLGFIDMDERFRLGEPVDSFLEWWDAQTDPQAAVDAVWGEA